MSKKLNSDTAILLKWSDFDIDLTYSIYSIRIHKHTVKSEHASVILINGVKVLFKANNVSLLVSLSFLHPMIE